MQVGTQEKFDRLARRIGFVLFLRCILMGVCLATALVVPFVVYMFVKHWSVLLLVPVLVFLCWSYFRRPYSPHASCPECAGDLRIETRPSMQGKQPFLVCTMCGREADTGLQPGEPA